MELTRLRVRCDKPIGRVAFHRLDGLDQFRFGGGVVAISNQARQHAAVFSRVRAPSRTTAKDSDVSVFLAARRELATVVILGHPSSLRRPQPRIAPRPVRIHPLSFRRLHVGLMKGALGLPNRPVTLFYLSGRLRYPRPWVRCIFLATPSVPGDGGPSRIGS